jgi:hypothetical protein
MYLFSLCRCGYVSWWRALRATRCTIGTWPPGREQTTAQEAVFDGFELGAACRLALLECSGWLELGELSGVGFALRQPGKGGDGELGGEVDLFDVDEAGGRQEWSLLAPGGDRPRP